MVLVPLTAATAPGAHGSTWKAELQIFNASSVPLRLPGPPERILAPVVDPAVVVPPRQTEEAFLDRAEAGRDGAFLYVPTPLLWAPKMSLRARDTSQDAASLGTDIPVVNINNASGDVLLIDVPTDANYRATLRIYAFTAAPMLVGVSVFPEDGDTVLQHYDVELHGIVNVNYDPFPPYPAYLAIDPLTPVVRASGKRVRIELTNYGNNVSPPPPAIWGFVSITNNVTQQVTAVTPR
jgi:hypothetical protein